MATQTIRPNGTVTSTLWTRTGGSTAHGVLSDDSDATYMSADATVSPPGSRRSSDYNLGTYTLAAGERVARVRMRVRAAGVADGPGSSWWIGLQLRTKPYANTTETSDEVLVAGAGTTIVNKTTAWDTGYVGSWDAGPQQDYIDALQVLCDDPGNEAYYRARGHELYVDLDVWARCTKPTVTTSPSGTITNTDVVTVESYISNVNDGLPATWTKQVMVVDDATYAGFATDADITAEWDGDRGTWSDENTSLTPNPGGISAPDEIQTAALPNSDTYKAFVRYGKNDVAGQTLYSEWGESSAFTLTLTLPAAPTVATTVQTTSGRNKVDVTTAALTHDTLESIRVERSDDGGTTWATIRGGYITEEADGDPLAGATLYTFYDYDAPRGTTIQYRARVVEGITASGTTLTSAWDTDTATSHADDGTWWVYDVAGFAAVLGDVRIQAAPAYRTTQLQGVFRPLESAGAAVVVQGAVGGSDGSWDIRATGTTETDAVAALVAHAGTLLVKSPFGWQRYVRWVGDRQVVEEGTADVPRHRYTLGFVEVASGITVDG